MATSPTTLERAFELAKSGNFRTIEAIHKQLGREGFSNVTGHLSGKLLRKQLWALIKAEAVAEQSS